PYPRSVDDPARVARKAERDGGRRRMPAASGPLVNLAGGPLGVGDERVDDRRLAHTGVPDEHGDAVGQVVLQLVDALEPAVHATGNHVRDLERRIPPDEVVGRGEVSLGEDEKRVEGGVVGGGGTLVM